MSSSPSPSPSHEPPRVLFPQECTHDTHCMSHKGDLYTALITGGNRLVLLKNGVVLAQSCPLLHEAVTSSAEETAVSTATTTTTSDATTTSGGATTCTRSESARALPASTSRVCAVSVYYFIDDVLRVAVATTVDVLLFEFDDAGHLWVDTRESSFWHTAEDINVVDTGGTPPPSAAASFGKTSSSASRFVAMQGRANVLQASNAASSPAAARASDPVTKSRQPTQRQGGLTGRLRWRRVGIRLDATLSSTRPGLNNDGSTPFSWTASFRSATHTATCTGLRGASAAAAAVPVRISPLVHPSLVRALEFVSMDTLLIVLDSEAVLIVLGNSNAAPGSTLAVGGAPFSVPVPDRVVWRSMGVYGSLAVCRVNHHVALTLGNSTIVVFPSCVSPADDQMPPSAPASPLLVDEHHLSRVASTSASSLLSTKPASGSAHVTMTESHNCAAAATPAFSTTSHPTLVGGSPGTRDQPTTIPGAPAAGVRMTLAERALTTSVGIYHITDMQWHCVSSHTLLCVTCKHPKEETAYLMLYTVQSLPSIRRYTNIMREHADGGWGPRGGGFEGEELDTADEGLNMSGRRGRNIRQLVPAGTIALAYTASRQQASLHAFSCTNASTAFLAGNSISPVPTADTPLHSSSLQQETPDAAALSVSTVTGTTWGGAPPPPVAEMHTGLVPNFSNSAEANSMSSRMEFLHVEGDGTVRTSSYAFGRQKHASFAKQRAVGSACRELLQPLLRLYGSLVKVTFLPAWRARPIELGHDTSKQPCAVEMMLTAARRYRMVLRFASGVVLAVMVDLSAAVYRVECFLALGYAPLLSLRIVVPLAEAEKAQRTQSPPSSWDSAGSSTILIAGLLGFPTPARPTSSEPPLSLGKALGSLLEDGEDGAEDTAAAQRGCGALSADLLAVSSCASATSYNAAHVSFDSVTASMPPRTVWAVVLLQVEPSGMQARVLTTAPLTEVHMRGVSVAGAHEEESGGSGAQDECQRMSEPTAARAGSTSAKDVPPMPLTAASTAAAAGCVVQVTEDDVASFMTLKCPEKLRFMPALLRASQHDAGRLLTQLIAKYGAVEEGREDVGAAHSLEEKARMDGRKAEEGPVMRPPHSVVRRLSVLTGGCIGSGGEVLLLVRENAFCSGNNGGGEGSGAAALIRLCPPCLETLAPVHRLVATGACYIPFEPMVAEYVPVLAEVQQRWRSQPLSPAQLSSAWGATPPKRLESSVQDVREALRACQRAAAASEVAAVVQCEVVPGSPGTAYIRVRCPLLPDTGEAGARTSLQHLVLPSIIDPKRITCVMGALLVNHDVVIGVLCRTSERSSGAAPVLYLYGRPAVQSLAAPQATAAAEAAAATPSTSTNVAVISLASGSSAFGLEATLPGVDAFYFSASGEVVLLRQLPVQVGMPPLSGESAAVYGSRFERWLRCFPKEGDSRYSYVQDCTWCPTCSTTGGPLRSDGRGSSVTPETVTALMTLDVAGAREAGTVGLSVADAAKLGSSCMLTSYVLYATTSNSFIHVRQLPLRRSGATTSTSASSLASVVGEVALPQYHPDAVMQLIGMARWRALAKVLMCIADAVRAVVAPAGAGVEASTVDASSNVTLLGQSPEELARRLCTSAVARDFHDRLQLAQYEEVLHRVTPPQLSVATLHEEETQANAMASMPASSVPCTTAVTHLYDFSATYGVLVNELTQLLPQATLSGLDSPEHLKLLCILQALRDTLPLSRSVDEAAARYLFYSRYMGLERRLRRANAATPVATATGSCVPVNSMLSFEVDRTATRTVETASYLWAAMSDSQSTLLSLLFDKASTVYVDGGAGGGAGGLGDSGCGSGGTGGASAQDLTWEQVKQSGVTFWLRSVADLRAIADRVARHQYQLTKEVTDCALMYCVARKVGTLAALAKAQNNQRLHGFFSRNFAGDEHNRAAASANAYAAIRKNMPQYGAAFFLLAGDVRSAVQVLLQRCHNPSLALFVLRAAGDSAEEQSSAAETALQWYVAQRTAEAEMCGALDMWELTCLNWLDTSPPRVSPEVAVQRRIRALQHIAAHPTAHPEILCVLRYARDCVASLAYRGDQLLSPDRELVYLLRLGRYCLAHRLDLNSYLYYHDAEALLRRLRAEATAVARSGALQPTSNGGGTSRRAPPQTAKMSADFNTGTLLFRGFDGSDDDDEGGNGDSGISTHPRQGDSSSDVGASAAHASSPVFTLSDEAAAAVEAEVKYVYARTGAIRKPGSVTATVTGATADAGGCEDLLRRMLLSFTMTSSFMMTPSMLLPDGGGRAAETGRMPSLAVSSVRPESASVLANPPEPFQQLLTSLLYLLSARGVRAPRENGATTGQRSGSNGASSGIASAVQGRSAVAALPQRQPAGTALCPEVLAAAPSLSIAAPAATDGGWHALCVPLLHFLLSKVALRCANYVVLLALQQVPVSTEGVLRTAVQANLMSDDGDALQGVSTTLLPDAGTAVPPLAAPPPPLHRPLTAFFLLLMHHMRSHYSDLCAADGGCLVGGQASTSPGHQVEAGCDKGRVWGVLIDDEADGAMFVSSEHDDQTHQSTFDALLAAAAAAEASNNFAAQAGRESSRAGACWGSFCPQAYADGTTSGANVPDGSMTLRLTDSAQVSLLLSCCQAQLHLRLMEHLKQLTRSELDSEVMTPTTQRAVDAGLLYADALSPEAQVAVVQRRLLQCTLLLDVTLQWSTLSEECMMRIYAAEPQRAPGPLTDPNGVFLEAQHTAGLMRAVLVAVLDAPPRCVQSSTFQATAEASTAAGRGGGNTTYGEPFDPMTPPPMSSTSWLEDSTLTMLELCATQLELFWTLPAPSLTQCCQLAAPTRAALKLLQETTALHRPARVLLERTLRPVKVETGPLVEHNHLRNAGAPFNAAASASPGFSVFSASATLASTLHKTGAESPAVRDVALTPDEPHQGSSHTEVYCPALSYMLLSWMRRHHTHALLRRLLLMVMLDRGEGEGQRLVSTDRLILAQNNHSVTGVHFDASSCDSVVWTTERGTSVGHGFRELLAGDNEEALWKQTTERNLATAAFTLGLTAQHERLRLASEHAGQKYTPAVIEAVTAKSALESRPRLGEVVNAMPSSHPHLPFFVSRHLDGHLDLYPFASQECVASFRCAVRHSQSPISRSSGTSSGVDSGHGTASIWRAWGVEAGPTAAARAHSVRLGGSAGGTTVFPSPHHGGCYPVTPVAFSPSGYIIAVGLSDGSVAGWRFAAAAVESAPAFFFEKLFTPFGIRSCTFCGDRSSLMVVVGVAKEPHQCRRGNPTADVTSVLGVRDPPPLSALAPPLASSSIAATPPSASAACSSSTAVDVGAGEAVGEMLILDTILGAGAVTARCALPFLPAYAVYITPLRAVLMVSVDGLLATYAVETARFAVLGTVPITTVLRSALGPSLGADGGDADADVAPSRTGTMGSDTVYITCVAQSNYDPLVAFGVSNGLVLLLHFRNISAGMARTERRIRDEGEDRFAYYPPRALSADSDATGTHWSQRRAAQQMERGAAASASATARATSEAAVPTMDKAFLERLPQTSVLSEATYMQVAPHVNTRNAIMDLVFSPSMLLAGLQDGKVMAASLIAHATRACLTAGSGVRVDLLECS